MKIGDLVRHASEWEDSRGIVLHFYPCTPGLTAIYWLSHKHYGSHNADDLEVISESR
jgi:hypothetical protein